MNKIIRNETLVGIRDSVFLVYGNLLSISDYEKVRTDLHRHLVQSYSFNILDGLLRLQIAPVIREGGLIWRKNEEYFQ